MVRHSRSLPLLAALLMVLLPACGDDQNPAVQPGVVAPEADLWLASSTRQSLTHLDRNGTVAGSVDLCCVPRDVTAAAGAVWVSTDTGKLLRIDPAAHAVSATIDIGARPGLVAGDDRGIWVSDGARDLVRVDPATNQIVARIPAGSADALIVDIDLAADAVWVTVEPAFGLVKIDLATNQITTRSEVCLPELCHYGATAMGEDGIWILDDTAGELVLADPATAGIGRRWSVGTRGALRDLVATPEGLWINDPDRNTVLWVDPDDPDRSETLDATISGPRLLRAAGGAVWVHAAGSGELVRIDPKTRSVVSRTPVEGVNAYAVG
jgi:streptogramin lyase